MSATTLSSCSRSCAYALVTTAGTASASTRNIFTGTTYSSNIIPNTDIAWNTGSSNITFSHTGTKIVEIIACLSVSGPTVINNVTWQLYKTGVGIGASLGLYMRVVNTPFSSTISAITSVTSTDTIYAQINTTTTNTIIQLGSSIMVKCIGGTQTGPSPVLMSTLVRCGYFALATATNTTTITNAVAVSWATSLNSSPSPTIVSWGTSSPTYTLGSGLTDTGYRINITGYYQIIINAVMQMQNGTGSYTITPRIAGSPSTEIKQQTTTTNATNVTCTYNRILNLTATQIFGVDAISSVATGVRLQTGSSIYIRLISV